MILTVAEVKQHLRIEYTDDDELIRKLILQSQATAEDYCRVNFDTAYEVVPEPVRLAVLLMVSHYYENRDNPDRQIYITMRLAFQNLLYPYRDPAQLF